MPTTALVKTAQSPALARVASQLALMDKLLAKPKVPFLIPYRKGDKWGFCDRNKNIVIDCVFEYLNFSDDHRKANWYVYYNSELECVNWKEVNLTADESILPQNNHVFYRKYMVLKFTGREDKALLLVALNDAFVRKGIIDNRETITIGRQLSETIRLWWIRKPLDVVVNIGDIITTEVEADFMNEIERD